MANFFANQAFDINTIDLNFYVRNLFNLIGGGPEEDR